MNIKTIREVFGNPMPKLKEHHVRIAFLVLTIIFAVITILSIILKRASLVYYFIIFVLFLFVSFRERKQVHLQWETLIFVALLAVLDFMGGVCSINGTQLYNYWFYFIRYDQIVHAMCFAIVAFAIYDFVIPYLKPVKPKYSLTIILLAALGVGAIVEIVEFTAVLLASMPVGVYADNVGSYFNNAADLVYDLIGAIWGTLLANFIHTRKSS